MPYANINASLSQTDIDLIEQKFNEIKAFMPFLVNLTTNERKRLFKFGKRYPRLLDRAIELSTMSPQFYPPFLNPDDMRKDHELWKQMAIIEALAESLLESIQDTRAALRSESIGAARAFYELSKRAALNNVPGADTVYEDLRISFQDRGGNRKKPSPNPNPENP